MKKSAVNVFELFAKIGLDDTDYKKKLDDSESKFSKFAGSLKNGLATAAKVGGAALGAAATAVTALTKASVENYAEYEQLVGGAQLMFGKAYDTVAENAKKAYATVQMSQNEYLQQVNGFATGLKTSLKGNEKAAAELADRIVTAEADIIAATGNTAENVQNAFNGIMKSNFTMLDNLQIGITPTKEGFQEVIDKVNDWNKANGEATKYQMDNLADMQSALVDYIDMVGMSGYAQREASQTIQGSLASTKAAWSNLITGLADDNANFEELVGGLVTSLVGDGTEFNPGLIGNIMPRIQSALGGVGDLVTGLAPVISDNLPALFSSILPSVLEGAMSIVSSVGSALPGVLDSISGTLVVVSEKITDILSEGLNNESTLEKIVQSAFNLIMILGSSLLDQAPLLLESGLQIILTIASGLSQSLPEMIPSVVAVIMKMVDVLTQPDMISELTQVALDLIIAFAEGLMAAMPEITAKVPEIILNLVEGLLKGAAQIVLAAGELIVAFIEGIANNNQKVLESGTELITKITEGFEQKMEDIKTWGKDLIDNFIAGIKERWANLTAVVSDTAQIVKDFLGFSEPDKGPLSNFHTYAPDMMDLFAEGIEKNSDKVLEKVEKLANKIKEKFNEIQSYFQTTSDIAQLEYELWEMTEGIDASDTEKLAKKMELLNKQLSDQKEIVDANNEAYQEMVKLYGEGSVQAMEYKKQLLEEQVEYQKLQNELGETNKSYEDLTKKQRTWGDVAVETVRNVANAIKEATQTSDAVVAEQQEKSNRSLLDGISELTSLFKSGKAKTNISNARDLRSVSYG